MMHSTNSFRIEVIAAIALPWMICGCAVAPPSQSGIGGALTPNGIANPVPTASPMTLPRYLGVESVALGARRIVYRSRVRMSTVLPFVAPQPAAAAPVAICDPACVQSPAPAVATAAAIQQAEATAPAKVQALGFLANQNMCRNPQVEEAFLAAMDDPSETVRIAAVEGILQSLESCGCNHSCQSCCTAAIQSKLQHLAYSMDERGCWCESSPKVRRLARRAACTCQPSHVELPMSESAEVPAPEVMELSRRPLSM